jgi:hypothetical protein
LKSAWPIGYKVGKAIANTLSLLAALSIGVDQTDGARIAEGARRWLLSSYKISSSSISVIFRFGTID